MSVRTIIAQSKRTGHLVRLVPLYAEIKGDKFDLNISPFDEKDGYKCYVSATLHLPTAYTVELDMDECILMNAPFVEKEFEFLEEEQ